MRHTPNASRTTRLQATALAGLIALGAGSALAQAAAPAVPGGTAMNFGQVTEAVTKLGYQDIREIERKSDKLYEVEARDAAGAKVELTVDARTGEILKTETKGRSR
ncbi:MAG: PepSY domain-containing protein [Hydrogenophaga sp.]|jgi:hypothetical protein|nr:PepSY domain-containing protein [Hydrogenophaga sp.]